MSTRFRVNNRLVGKRSKKQPHKAATAAPEKSRRSLAFAGVLVCFFLSGAGGLIYQVVWGKALGLVFGHTAYALGAVLAVFMGGLAAGSFWIGRWSESRPEPLETYAWLEFGIAVGGALSLAGISAVRLLYVFAFPHLSTVALLVVRLLGAAIVLLVPTFFMGGTLPVLARGVARYSTELGARFARLYWVNTTGAVAGTLAAGFLFLPALGMRLTIFAAVTLNVAAGLLALGLSRSKQTRIDHALTASSPAKPKSPEALGARESAASRSRLQTRFFLTCFAAVGATAMAYEIGWTRLLATQLGSSTYAFTLMLATFLAGIALGSALFELLGKAAASEMTFAWTQALTAITALAALAFFNQLPDVLPSILGANQDSFDTVVLAQFAVSALAMLPTAIVFGFNFPAVTKLIAATSRTNASSGETSANSEASGDGAIVGLAYCSNTLGAIVGAIAAGFWLLPKLGSFHLLAATAVANAGLAAVLSLGALFSKSSRSPRSLVFRFAGVVVSIALVLAAIGVGFTRYFYDPAVQTFNTLLYWNAEEKPLPLEMRQKAHMVDVVYWADGLNATISVGRTDNILALRTNGKVDASNNDITTQLMLGHIGAIAHRAPRRVLVIGFGAGMTLSALARYPEIERLDCVEIEPDVVRAAPLLSPLNRDVLKDPRVRMIYDDGRNFLLTTHEQYDLIVSEPSNPWIAGIASLFTREFYRGAQEHLAPGGIFVQWVHCYSLYPSDLKMVFATFLSEFHGATLWHGVKSDLLLVAPTPSAPTILENIQALWPSPRLHDDFDWMGIEKPEGLFGFYMLDDAGLRTFAATGQINTDDRTLLEYSAPRSLLILGLDDENLRELYQKQNNPLPDGFSGDLRDEVAAESAATALNAQNINDADRFVGALGERSTGPDDEIARGRDAIAHKDYDSAARDFDAALAANPGSPDAAWGLAETNRLTTKLDLAHQQFLRILERDPANLRALGSLEQLYSDTGHPAEAAAIERRLIAANPRASADDYAELGEMLKRAGKLDDAVVAMQDCLARDPYNFQTNLNLGQIYDVQKRYLDARRRLEFVERFFPDVDSQTYSLLYEVDTALGDSKAAADAVRFGLSLFPNDPDLLKLDVPL